MFMFIYPTCSICHLTLRAKGFVCCSFFCVSLNWPWLSSPLSSFNSPRLVHLSRGPDCTPLSPSFHLSFAPCCTLAMILLEPVSTETSRFQGHTSQMATCRAQRPWLTSALPQPRTHTHTAVFLASCNRSYLSTNLAKIQTKVSRLSYCKLPRMPSGARAIIWDPVLLSHDLISTIFDHFKTKRKKKTLHIIF